MDWLFFYITIYSVGDLRTGRLTLIRKSHSKRGLTSPNTPIRRKETLYLFYLRWKTQRQTCEDRRRYSMALRWQDNNFSVMVATFRGASQTVVPSVGENRQALSPWSLLKVTRRSSPLGTRVRVEPAAVNIEHLGAAESNDSGKCWLNMGPAGDWAACSCVIWMSSGYTPRHSSCFPCK